jgi:hypothetical protein
MRRGRTQWPAKRKSVRSVAPGRNVGKSKKPAQKKKVARPALAVALASAAASQDTLTDGQCDNIALISLINLFVGGSGTARAKVEDTDVVRKLADNLLHLLQLMRFFSLPSIREAYSPSFGYLWSATVKITRV